MAAPTLRQRIIDSCATIVPRLVQGDVVEVREDAALMADLGLTSSTMLELLADYVVGHLISDYRSVETVASP